MRASRDDGVGGIISVVISICVVRLKVIKIVEEVVPKDPLIGKAVVEEVAASLEKAVLENIRGGHTFRIVEGEVDTLKKAISDGQDGLESDGDITAMKLAIGEGKRLIDGI